MHKPNKTEFSKVLLKQEAALIWIMSLSFIILAFYCIYKGFTGSLPWLAAMVGFPWTAYGVSQAFYYSKSKAENTSGGIKFEKVMEEARQIAAQYQNNSSFSYDIFSGGVDPFANSPAPYDPGPTYTITDNVDEYQI